MAREWLLVALIAIAPLSGAQVQPSLEFATLRFSGTAGVEARVQGATWINATGALDQLRLQIDKGEMELDETRLDVVVRGAGITPSNNSKSKAPIQDGRASNFSSMQFSRFIVAAEGSQPSSANMTAGALARNPLGRVDFNGLASDREDLVIRSPSGLSLSGEGIVRIHAPFVLAVWGANFTLTQRGEDREVRTGSHRESLVEGTPPATLYRAVLTEAVFHVEAGFVDLPMEETTVVYVEELALSLPMGTAALEHVRGALPFGEGTLLDGNQMEVEGPFAARFRASQDTVALSWESPPDVIRVDGQQVLPQGSIPWLWAMGGILLVAVPLLGSSVSRWRLQQNLQTLDGYVITGQFQAALALARRLRRRRPHLQDALVAEAVSLLNERNYAQAMAVLSEPHWKPEAEPTRAYLQAAALAGVGREQEAVRRLRQCLAAAPGMAREASIHPLLGGLLGRAKDGNRA